MASLKTDLQTTNKRLEAAKRARDAAIASLEAGRNPRQQPASASQAHQRHLSLLSPQ